MMKDSTKKIICYAAVGVLLFSAGFFAGRGKIRERVTTKIEYIESDPIVVKKDSVIPVYVKLPVDTANVIAAAVNSGKFTDLFPARDSLIYVTKDDTSAVIKDWATERLYDFELFDIDTVGTARFKARTQYNRLFDIESEFKPVSKIVTEETAIVKRFSPFVGAGITTSPEIVVNAGVYFEDKYGISVLYEYDWKIKTSNFGILASYKF